MVIFRLHNRDNKFTKVLQMNTKRSLPGYSSIEEFAETHQIYVRTVYKQLERGYCRWPRQTRKSITNDPAYRCWTSMLSRCTASDRRAKYYRDRGITVCARWRTSFKWFLADVGPRPGPGYSLDRIDVDGNYEPGNVRWATWKEQAANKRRK